MGHSREVQAAHKAAALAADIIRRYYRQDVAVEIKADSSPVTRADREAEEAIKSVLLDAFPGYGFSGEESGSTHADADNVWLVDPLDGTKSFVRGYPFISTQIALQREGKLHLGVSSAPLFDELAWAERGAGAWLNGQRLRVSDIGAIADSTLSSGNLASLAASSAWPAYGRLVGAVNRIRGYGDFYHYHLLAAGRIDAVIESDVNILDIGALCVIVEEAGGRFTDLDGQAIGLDTRSVLASNKKLFDPIVQALGGLPVLTKPGS